MKTSITKILIFIIIFSFISGCSRRNFIEIDPIITFGERGKKEGQFLNIDGIAVDHEGNIYVADIKRLQVFDEKGNFLHSTGEAGAGDGQIGNEAVGIAINSKDEIIITDQDNYRCQVFSEKSKFIRAFGLRGTEEGRFLKPQGVCVDEKDRIYVVDNEGDSVQIFSPEGEFILKFGTTGSGKGEFDEPESIVIYKDIIYVADEGNGRIQYFNLQGKYLGEINKKSTPLTVTKPDEYDRDYTGGYFKRDVEGIVFDDAGYLYAANEDEGIINIFNQEGRPAGEFTSSAKRGLKKIQGLAVNKDKTRLYVCDQGNSRIQIFDISEIKEKIFNQ